MRALKWLLAGGGLCWLARLLEDVGDSFPLAAEGVSSGRLLFHSVALLTLLAAVFCFVRAGLVIRRGLRGRTPAPEAGPKRPAVAAPGPEASVEFDPDAALARYLEAKAAQPVAPPRPSPTGFGRKRAAQSAQ